MNCRPRVLVRILTYLAARHKDAFPEIPEPYDYLVPPTSFGAWLKNQRLRCGLEPKQLARLLGVNRETVRRYEANETKPVPEIRTKLRRVLNLNEEEGFLWANQ